MSNKKLINAQNNPNNDFYTRYETIEEELVHYPNSFENKVVYCNCDDYRYSNFFKYFVINFNKLKLKKLVCTNFKNNVLSDKAFHVEISKVQDNIIVENILDVFQLPENFVHELEDNGDYRSFECLDLLSECDIVITNPPFSLFNDLAQRIARMHKDFIMLGPMTAFSYVKIFQMFKEGKLFSGVTLHTKPVMFETPDGTLIDFENIRWFSTLKPSAKNFKDLELTKEFKEENYQRIDNFNYLNVNRCADIPKDYKDIMAVPVGLIDYYDPDKFELIEVLRKNFVNGHEIFKRLLIRVK